MIDYDKAIADAARAYVLADRKFRVDRTEPNRLEMSRAYEKLAWMVDAPWFGWNPEVYQPED